LITNLTDECDFIYVWGENEFVDTFSAGTRGVPRLVVLKSRSISATIFPSGGIAAFYKSFFTIFTIFSKIFMLEKVHFYIKHEKEDAD
jgi:hypothetical protein